MQLEERISTYTKECFQNWEATEESYKDTGRAFYMLKNPNNNVEKVCMFRDGFNMMLYGDFGCYHFDEMTWVASPHNLAYNNLSYQMEKLSQDSKAAAYEFLPDKCLNDFFDWAYEKLENHFELEDEEIDTLSEILRDVSLYDMSLRGEIMNCLKEEHKKDASEIYSLFLLTARAFSYGVESHQEWVVFLEEYRDEIEQFDDFYDSGLFDAGWCIKERLLISLYAMQVCSKKLKEKEQEKENEEMEME